VAAEDGTVGRKNRLETAALLGCLLVIFALRWHPVWSIGFYQDDSVTSSWLYDARGTGRTILAACRDFFRAMVTFQGRIAPVYSFAILPVIMLVEERLWLYRLLQAAFHLATLLAFAGWLRRAGARAPYVYLCLGTLASIYEIRDYHDASFSQAMILPLTALFGFLALERAEALRDGGMSGGWRRVAACSGLSLAAVSTHEFGLGFAVAAASTVLLGPQKLRERITAAGAVLLPSAILILAGLRLKVASTYVGTSFGSSSVDVIAITFLKQLLATLPFSYAGARPDALKVSAETLYLANVVLGVLGATFVAALCWYSTRSETSPARGSAQVASAMVLFISAGLTSVSAKYQRELQWGTGYAQTYIQYFCLSVILVGGLAGILRGANQVPRFPGLRWTCRLVAAIGLGCTFFMSFSHSSGVADFINRHWRYPREALAVALEDQARSRRVSQAEVRVDRPYLQRWENVAFLFQHTGWRGQFVTADAALDGDPLIQRFGIEYPRIIDKSDIVLLVFSDLSSSGGQIAKGRTTIYALCTDRRKLDAAFVSLGPMSRWVALRDFRSYSARGWTYKQIDIPQADASEHYGIRVF